MIWSEAQGRGLVHFLTFHDYVRIVVLSVKHHRVEKHSAMRGPKIHVQLTEVLIAESKLQFLHVNGIVVLEPDLDAASRQQVHRT